MGTKRDSGDGAGPSQNLASLGYFLLVIEAIALASYIHDVFCRSLH